MDQATTRIRSNLNRLPRQDVLVTTLKVDSKQDVTHGGIGAVIVDGGLVVEKGLRLGRSETMVPGVLTYLDGRFLGFKEGCRAIEFECRPATAEIEAEIVDENAKRAHVSCYVEISSNGRANIWGEVNEAFFHRGHITIPYKVRRMLYCTINCDLDSNGGLKDNYTKPLLYSNSNERFDFNLNTSGDVFIYNWHIECLLEGEEGCQVPSGLPSVCCLPSSNSGVIPIRPNQGGCSSCT